MSGFVYYALTISESALSVFGVRSPYEQPAYTVTGHLTDGVELRRYETRMAVETSVDAGDDGGQAFGRLFRYITGANAGARKIAMTIPVEQTPAMRFFLPKSVVQAGPPPPSEGKVHLVTLQPATYAVIRFTGLANAAAQTAPRARLLAAIKQAGRTAEGSASLLSYDPPFAIPFLRRNEIAVQVSEGK